MIGLLGKKIGMTQIFDEDGRQIPVTLLQVGPCKVTDVKTSEKHGYQGIQLAFDACREKVLNKPKLGHLKKANAGSLRHVREIRTNQVEGLKIGAEVCVDNFQVGDFVDVIGTSIGRGFQGTVKRHNFKGALTMGRGDMQGREPGSIGSSSFPSRVFKGMKMSGHMGDARTTVQNLKVVKIDQSNHILAVKGSVPGFEGRFLIVRESLKRGAKRKWKVQGSAEGAPAASSAADNPEKS